MTINEAAVALSADAPMPRMSRYWLIRDRVVDAVQACLDNQLVILRAPRGTGKSVAVRQLADRLRRAGRPVHLVGGVARECGSLSAGLAAVLGLPGGEDAAWRKAGRALADRDDVLIIDDLDLTADDEDALIDFLSHESRFTVLLTTRRRTRLERTSVAVQVDTQLLDSALLEFTDAETSALLELCELEADAVSVAVLRDELDGHAAAIHLAATALRLQGMSHPRRSDIEQAADHAVAEFAELSMHALGATAAEGPEMLLLPPYLTSGAVSTLYGVRAPEAEQALAALETAGLGEWDATGTTPRFRPLPVLRRGVWRAEALRTVPHEAVDALIDYLAGDGDPDAACDVALSAERWPALVEVLRTSFEELYDRDPLRLAHFLRMIPAAQLDAEPELATRIAILDLDAETSRARMSRLERLVRAVPAGGGDLSHAHAVRRLTTQTGARRRLGQFGRAAEAAERIADPVNKMDLEATSTSAAVAALGLYESGLSLMHMRRLREARWRFADVRRRAPGSRIEDEAIAALALLDLLEGEIAEAENLLAGMRGQCAPRSEPIIRVTRAFLAMERGDISAATDELDRLEAVAPHSEYWMLVSALRAWSKLFAGEANAALAILRQGQALETFMPVSPLFGIFLQAVRSDALVAVRQAPSALAVSRVPEHAGELTAASLTRALLQTGQDAQVTWLASQRLSKNAPTPRVELELLLVRACACLHMGQTAEAAASLEKAEAVTRAHGVRVPWRFVADDDREQLRAVASASVVAMLDADPPGFRGTLALPRLSRRENMVLARLRAGGSVVQIAKDLMVSSNTVKTQLRSIYRKLGVSNRAEAVRAALEWGLLQDAAGQLRQAP